MHPAAMLPRAEPDIATPPPRPHAFQRVPLLMSSMQGRGHWPRTGAQPGARARSSGGYSSRGAMSGASAFSNSTNDAHNLS